MAHTVCKNASRNRNQQYETSLHAPARCCMYQLYPSIAMHFEEKADSIRYLGEIIDAKGANFFTEDEVDLIAAAINAGPGDGPYAGPDNFRYFAIDHALEQLKSCAQMLRWRPEHVERAYALIKKIEATL
jgi:hypothetical protein